MSKSRVTSARGPIRLPSTRHVEEPHPRAVEHDRVLDLDASSSDVPPPIDVYGPD
jgi:hypothetical protein